MTRRSTIAERTRVCPVCRRPFLVDKPSRPQRFCGHSCAWTTFGHRVVAAAHEPDVEIRRGDTMRFRGKGVSYIKRGGRHEHRGVAEGNLDRSLQEGEIAFHKDRQHRNNDPANIAVAPSRAEFARQLFLGTTRPPRMTCKRGHPLAGDNVRLTSIGRRQCVTCARAYDREWKRERRVASGSTESKGAANA